MQLQPAEPQVRSCGEEAQVCQPRDRQDHQRKVHEVSVLFHDVLVIIVSLYFLPISCHYQKVHI